MAWRGCLHWDKRTGNRQYSYHRSSSCCPQTSGHRACFHCHLSVWLGRDTLHWVPRSTELPGEERWPPSCFQSVEWKEIFCPHLYTQSFSKRMTCVRNFRCPTDSVKDICRFNTKFFHTQVKKQKTKNKHTSQMFTNHTAMSECAATYVTMCGNQPYALTFCQ